MNRNSNTPKIPSSFSYTEISKAPLVQKSTEIKKSTNLNLQFDFLSYNKCKQLLKSLNIDDKFSRFRSKMFQLGIFSSDIALTQDLG